MATRRLRLSGRDAVLCASYGILAVGALVVTQVQLVRFLRQPDNGGVWGFVTDGFVNPAAAFLTSDLLIVAVAALVYMVVEARRIGLRFVWTYVAVSIVIAISVGLPLFLLARQLTLAPRARPTPRTAPAAPG